MWWQQTCVCNWKDNSFQGILSVPSGHRTSSCSWEVSSINVMYGWWADETRLPCVRFSLRWAGGWGEGLHHKELCPEPALIGCCTIFLARISCWSTTCGWPKPRILNFQLFLEKLLTAVLWTSSQGWKPHTSSSCKQRIVITRVVSIQVIYNCKELSQ